MTRARDAAPREAGPLAAEGVCRQYGWPPPARPASGLAWSLLGAASSATQAIDAAVKPEERALLREAIELLERIADVELHRGGEIR